MTLAQQFVRVGVAIFVIKRDCLTKEYKILIGRRGKGDPGKPINGQGCFQVPGGHLEWGESFKACASRELFEETGIHVEESDIMFLTATNDIAFEENRHYVTIFTAVRVEEQVEAILMEPNKCEGWNWYTVSESMKLMPLFNPLKEFFEDTEAKSRLIHMAESKMISAPGHSYET